MPGPSVRVKQRAEEVEVVLYLAIDKLKEHVWLFLGEDESQDESKRNKEYLRDVHIIPRMRRLKKRVLMISDTEGVRLEQYLQLSRKDEVAELQAKRLRALAKKHGAPDPIVETHRTIYSVSPEFKDWLEEHPENRKKANKIAGALRLCPIREEKEHKGEIHVQCEQ